MMNKAKSQGSSIPNLYDLKIESTIKNSIAPSKIVSQVDAKGNHYLFLDTLRQHNN